MRNLILLFLAFILNCISLNAQTAPEWTRVLQTSSYNYPASKVITVDGETIYLAGNIGGPVTFENITYTSIGFSDMIVFKFNSIGDVNWAKQFNAQINGTINPEAMKVDANHNIYIAGTFNGKANFGSRTIMSDAANNAFIAKFDTDGNPIWVTSFFATGTGSSKIVFDTNGNTFLLSKSTSLLKFNTSGSIIWEQNYPDHTLQAVAVNGPDLFIGGALQPGVTKFGTFNLPSANTYNTGFMAKADLDGIYTKTFIEGTPQISTKAGNYHSVGTFIHPTSGTIQIDQTKILTATSEDVLLTSIGYLPIELGTMILTINPDNSVTISGSYNSSPLIQDGINMYDPDSKTFTLNYYYTGTSGNRVISEILKMNPPAITGDGTAISDLMIDNNGNIIATGAYTQILVLGVTTITNPSSSHYTFIAKCNNDFEFAWTKSSDKVYGREMFTYRLFQDNANNIYQFGITTYGSSTFTYGMVSVIDKPQFLFKFDSNGEVINGFGLQKTSVDRLIVTPTGKVVSAGTIDNDGTSQVGNFFITQMNNNISAEWQKKSSNHKAGTIDMNYIKHDSVGNTYAQARILGYCNFYGVIINSNDGITVNTKFDKSGNIMWINQINDLHPTLIYGPKFSLDKDNNLLTVGKFSTTLSIGTQNFINANSEEDSYIVKYTSDGQIEWAVQLAADGYHSLTGIISDKSGNVIVSGEFRNQLTVGNITIDAGQDDGAFVIKLDRTGNCLWANGYPVGNDVYSAMVACDDNNNIYLAGEMYNYTTNQLVFGPVIVPQGTNDGATVLVKFDPNGVPLWGYTYGGVSGSTNPDSWPADIKTDTAGNIYLIGVCPNSAQFGSTTLTNPIGNSYSNYLTKINKHGDVVWADAIYFKSPVYRYGDLLDLDNNGNLYVGGHFKDAILIQGTTYNPVGSNDFFAAKYKNNGAFQWIKTMPANTNGISALSVYSEDILSICGTAGKDPTLGNFTIDRLGASTCIIATLGVLEPFPNTLFVDFTEGSETTFSFTSNTDWIVTSDQEWLIISSNSGTGNGTLTFTASENTTGEARKATVTITFPGTKTQTITLTIIQQAATTGISDLLKKRILVYPNPANTTLFLNTEVQNAVISIYDSKGKMVFNKHVNASEINISNLRNGIYTIKVVNNKGIKIQKFVKQ